MQTGPDPKREFCGITPFPSRGGLVTDELINAIREKEFEEEVASNTSKARALAKRAMEQGELDKKAGFDRNASFQELLDLHTKITRQL